MENQVILLFVVFMAGFATAVLTCLLALAYVLTNGGPEA